MRRSTAFRQSACFVFLLGVSANASGCGKPEQGPECKAYLACVEEFDALRGTKTNVDRFLPEGACWGGDKGAEVCESSCRRGVPVLRAQEPRLACVRPK